MRRKVTIAFGLLAFICGYLLLRPRCDQGVLQTPFDSVAWKSANPNQRQSPRTARSAMICDLLHRYDFHGWRHDQLFQLLGEPNKWSGFEQWDVVYVLGLERMGTLSLDDEALGFKFDTDNRVLRYALSVN